MPCGLYSSKKNPRRRLETVIKARAHVQTHCGDRNMQLSCILGNASDCAGFVERYLRQTMKSLLLVLEILDPVIVQKFGDPFSLAAKKAPIKQLIDVWVTGL